MGTALKFLWNCSQNFYVVFLQHERGDLLSNQYQYQTGDKPPEGTYVCIQCADNPQTVIVPEMCEHLPECPHCGCTYWYKV
ncbi:hypothetical protein DWY99_08610 [[Clostridium] leptum]|uniref:Uncharacterized protein n=1 Tax=[Clostridium] leptum TaxID=1535 RepID=A0A412AWN9_9FIRM|nr:hypothetical protein DWY99_08610 [[Clostridium] leptum]